MMNFTNATGWRTSQPNQQPNLQTDSYDCGYGAGRTDLPIVGYNPVYPSYESGFNNTSMPSTSTYFCTQEGAQGFRTNPNLTYANPYASQQYNPEPSSYNRHEPSNYSSQQYQAASNSASTKIITVDISRYTHKNTVQNLRRKFPVPARELITIPQAPIPPTFDNLPSSMSNRTTGSQYGSTSPRSTNTVIIEDSNVSLAPVVPQSDKNNSENSSKMTTPGFPSKNSRVGKKYQETIYGGNQNRWSSYGYPGYEYGYGPGSWLHAPPGPKPSGFGRPGPTRPNYGGPSGRGPIRPHNNKNDIPFVPMPEEMESLTLKLDADNIECFNGPISIFTTQHTAPVLIENSIYESIDHYYQYRKVIDLCGSASEKLTNCIRDRVGHRQDGKKEFNEKHNFSQVAREQLRLNKINHNIVEGWRRSNGLKAIQQGLMAKISQNTDFRHALITTKDKILVHSFAGDTIYGTGSQPPQVKKWCSDMAKSGNTKLVIPATFPLTEETIKHCPSFSYGRNVLGVILMQLREMLVNNDVAIVDLNALFTAIKQGKDPHLSVLEDLTITNNFSIGGGGVQGME